MLQFIFSSNFLLNILLDFFSEVFSMASPITLETKLGGYLSAMTNVNSCLWAGMMLELGSGGSSSSGNPTAFEERVFHYVGVGGNTSQDMLCREAVAAPSLEIF